MQHEFPAVPADMSYSRRLGIACKRLREARHFLESVPAEYIPPQIEDLMGVLDKVQFRGAHRPSGENHYE